jgi:hypothetical protein
LSPSVYTEGNIPTGTIRKSATREVVYVGSWNALGLSVGSFDSGWNISSNTSNTYFEYTFFGTGIEIQLNGANNVLNNTWSIDGNTDLSGYSTALIYGGTGLTFTASTGLLSGTGSTAGRYRIRISNLPYGKHTVKMLQNNASFNYLDTIDIITPTHFPNTRTGSLSMGPCAKILQNLNQSKNNFGDAKAWLIYDLNASTVVDSYNIAAVLKESQGVFHVYINKPFSTEAVAIASSQDNNLATVDFPFASNTGDGRSVFRIVVRDTAGAVSDPARVRLVFYGELEEEEL